MLKKTGELVDKASFILIFAVFYYFYFVDFGVNYWSVAMATMASIFLESLFIFIIDRQEFYEVFGRGNDGLLNLFVFIVAGGLLFGLLVYLVLPLAKGPFNKAILATGTMLVLSLFFEAFSRESVS